MELADKMLKSLEVKKREIQLNPELELLGYKQATVAFWKALYSRQMMTDFMESGKVPYEPNDKQRMEYINNARNALMSKPIHALITVNPKPGITLCELQKKLEKYISRKFIDGYIYCYEVRKEDHTGLHCHILLKYNCRPYDLKRNTKNTFKTLCDSNNPKILNIKYIEEDLLKSKIEYILGNKQDSKKDGVKASIEYREQNNLSPYYESTPPLPCRGAEYLNTSQPLLTGTET